MLVPILYYIIIPLWFCGKMKDRLQFWTGLLIYLFFGPFCRMIVLCYSVWNIDSFGWGKTRQVIAEDTTDVAAKDEKSQTPSSNGSTKDSSEKLSARIDPSEEEKKIGT